MPAPGVCMNILEARHKQDGSGSFDNPLKFFNQDYQQIKQYCISHNVRWVDNAFTHDQYSIGEGLLEPQDLAHVVWLRPQLIAPRPAFILDGISRFDFGQGKVGDCWFLASIGALTFCNDILKQVVPQEQAFDEKYCGVFHFRFWRFGKWIDVTIDDKLPTLHGRLIFVRSKDQNEFWPALLEKAYAKVCGSYADMNAGTPVEAMMDFTGGVHMRIKLEPTAKLWDLMNRAGQCTSLMGCSTHQGETSANNTLPNGLVQGHAYTVTGLIQVMSQGKVVSLVRLWNPWGSVEWKGDWSDRSPLWQTVSAKDREMCLSVADDGEFWMNFEDFCQFYTDIDICSTTPKFIDGGSSKHWKTSRFEGRWVAGTTAGGHTAHKGSFWTNPQYRVKISDDLSDSDGKKHVLVSLMQKSDKRNRHLVHKFNIGLFVFEDQGQKGKFPASFFSNRTPVAYTKTFNPEREVMEHLKLKPAEYLIVPTTFNPNESAAFILTILSKGETHGYETSGDHGDEPVKMIKKDRNVKDDENRKTVFRQFSDHHKAVDAEQLQMLLNEKILKGDLKSGGFSIDACRSMVALMDTSITGKLNCEEFVHLWNKVTQYREIFFRTDVSQTGTLSLSELRNAFTTADIKVSDDMLNLMAVRYGASSGHMTLESFISLIMRYSCMNKIFSQLSGDGRVLNLEKIEWMHISMYT
ncbi:calpain-1 catalytic subunit-like [Centropristis striata]|uniref:calpain-1 catalytic subunit-like n=1 Tax=Centropristis striata TaxID=184440 RepID=UPI0027DEF236|nr:calpain-1 catalytic subunit-like [Centropristis striata]